MRVSQFCRITALALAAAVVGCLSACGERSEGELIASAKARIEKDESQAALIELKRALQRNPQSGEARVLMGELLLKNGAPTLAVVELEKARDLRYSEAAVLPPLARALLASGRAKSVVERFENVRLADASALAELKTSVAIAYAALGSRDRSEAALDEVLKTSPKTTAARLEKARILGVRKATDAALAAVDALLADEPKNTAALQLQGDLLLGGKADAVAAEAAFRAALAVDPKFLPAHLALTSLAQKRGDDKAMRTQVAAMKQAVPKLPVVRFFEAQFALDDGKLTEARESAQELLRTAPTNAQVLQLAGAIELRIGTALTVAESHLNKALQQSPDVAMTRRLLGQTYLRLHQADKVLAVIEPLLQRDPPDVEALTLAAQASLQTGDKRAANKFFDLALRANPNSPSLRSALALSQIAKGDVDAGFKQLESAAAADKGIAADLALINARLRRNDLASAVAAVERLQAKAPNKPLPHYLRGKIALERGDVAGAKVQFERAVELDAAYYPAAASLASIDLEERKPDRALKRFDAVIARDPSNTRAIVAASELRQTVGAKPGEIAMLLADAVKRNPSDPDLRLRLIRQHVSERNAAAALNTAQDAVAAMPDDIRLLTALGEVQLGAGNSQQAISSLSKAAAAQPRDATALVRLADAYTQLRDTASAVRSLQQALRVDPTFLPAQKGLVQLALAEGRYEDGVAVAATVQKQQPTQPIGWVLESEVRARQGRWDAAIPAARAALERGKTASLAARLQVLYVLAGRRGDADNFVREWETVHPDDVAFQSELATLALATKDLATAETRLRNVVTAKPGDAMALNNLAWVLVQQKKTGALNLAQRANQLQPDSPTIMDTLASAYAGEKQLPQAIEWQRKAIAKSSGTAPHFRLKLARWLADSGDKSAARAELDILDKLGDKFSEQAQVATLRRSL